MTKHITSQIKDLNIPYPQKHLLELEVRQDLEHADSPDKQGFSKTDLCDLHEIHSTKIYRFLTQFGDRRKNIELLAAFIPLMTGVIFIFKEDFMMNFIREGGFPGMYAILIIGVFLLGKELLNMFRLLMIKDHSAKNLDLDTSSVLLGCLALVFMALGCTALGIYKTADTVTRSQMPYELLIVGAKESMTPLVLGSLLSVLIVLAHYATRNVLRLWHAPLSDA